MRKGGIGGQYGGNGGDGAWYEFKNQSNCTISKNGENGTVVSNIILEDGNSYSSMDGRGGSRYENNIWNWGDILYNIPSGGGGGGGYGGRGGNSSMGVADNGGSYPSFGHRSPCGGGGGGGGGYYANGGDAKSLTSHCHDEDNGFYALSFSLGGEVADMDVMEKLLHIILIVEEKDLLLFIIIKDGVVEVADMD